MAAYVELYVDQGATFNSIINITDDLTNDYINVANYTVRSQMRRSYYSSSVTANLVCSVANSATGEIQLSLGAANTALIKAGRYLFDLETQDTNGNVVRVLEGIITVNPRITR